MCQSQKLQVVFVKVVLKLDDTKVNNPKGNTKVKAWRWSYTKPPTSKNPVKVIDKVGKLLPHLCLFSFDCVAINEVFNISNKSNCYHKWIVVRL